MKQNLEYLLLIIVIIALIFVAGFGAGSYWRYEKMINAPAKITYQTQIDTVFIPKKEEHKAIKKENVSADQEDRIDSLIAQAVLKDSLIEVLNDKMQIRITQFEDTIKVSDSTGSFYLREIHTIDFNPLTEIIGKQTQYFDGRLTTIERIENKYIPVPITFTEKVEYGGVVSAVVLVTYILLSTHLHK